MQSISSMERHVSSAKHFFVVLNEGEAGCGSSEACMLHPLPPSNNVIVQISPAKATSPDVGSAIRFQDVRPTTCQRS